MTDTDRDQLRSQAAALHLAGHSIRSIAKELGIGRTAAGNLVEEIEAERVDLDAAGKRTLAAIVDAPTAAAARTARLERMAAAAEEAGDYQAVLAIMREQRLNEAPYAAVAAKIAHHRLAAETDSTHHDAIEAAEAPPLAIEARTV